MACTPALTPAFLVIGPVATEDDVDNLRGYAFDVAHQMGAPATYALHDGYDVHDFAAVFTAGSVTDLRDAPTLVLVAEALAAGVQVLEPQGPQMAKRCDECGQAQTIRTVTDAYGDTLCATCRGEASCTWCGDDANGATEIVERGETWLPLHVGCVRGVLPVTA